MFMCISMITSAVCEMLFYSIVRPTINMVYDYSVTICNNFKIYSQWLKGSIFT